MSGRVFNFVFNLKTNVILKQAKLIWQISNKITPKCNTEIFNTNCKKQTYSYTINYIQPKLFRTTYRERFISNVGIQIWNEIPNKIK